MKLAWLLLALELFTAQANAQGCSACRDAASGSTSQVRSGLRRGILMLGVPAGGIFVGILLVARNIEKQRSS